MPVSCDSVCGTPEQQIRNQGQDNRHNQSLLRVEPAQLANLINEIYGDSDHKDLRDVLPAFCEQVSPIDRISA